MLIYIRLVETIYRRQPNSKMTRRGILMYCFDNGKARTKKKKIAAMQRAIIFTYLSECINSTCYILLVNINNNYYSDYLDCLKIR